MRLVLLLFVVGISVVNGLKFLMYNPKSSKSHVGFVNNVADALIDAGHEVVMYMPNLDDKFGNASNHKRARIIERECDFLEAAKNSLLNDIQSSAWTENSSVFSLIRNLKSLGSFFKTACEHQLQDEAMMEQLRRENFDLGFSEFFDSCGFGIFEKIGLKKHILLYSSIFPPAHAANYGIPSTPSFVPELHASSAPPFTFGQRFANQFAHFMGRFAIDKFFIERVAEAFPSNNVSGNIREMMAKSSYFFVNTDELVDFARPVSHKVVQIGGMGVKKVLEKRGKLEKKYQGIFDNSKRGVIYISFGSVAASSKMPDQLKQAFLGAIKEMPDVNFLWKYEVPEDPIVQDIPNLFVDKWLPQKEIFLQEKLLAFVSHGGMNSIVESTSVGVPIIGIPLFADQYRNSFMAQNKGVGIKLDKNTLTKDILIDTFRTMINDPSYKENAKTLATMIANKPTSADQRIAMHAEFAARFDVHNALDSIGRKLSIIEFYNLDVLLTMFGIVVVSIFAVYKLLLIIIKLLLRRVFSKTKRD